MKTRFTTLLTFLFVLLANHSAFGCAACWNPAGGDKMTKAAAVGIGAMVILMFIMLGTILACGWRLAWRAKHPLPDYNELLSEEPKSDDIDPKA